MLDFAPPDGNILQKTDKLLEEAGTSKLKLSTAQIWVKDIRKDLDGVELMRCGSSIPALQSKRISQSSLFRVPGLEQVNRRAEQADARLCCGGQARP